MLSPSEKRVVLELMEGRSNKEIGDLLGVTEKTVRFHITNIFAKEGVTTRYELIMKDIILGAP